MISGPGYVCWIEQGPQGWYVHELGPWSCSYGPYRWRWAAKFVKWAIES